MHILHYHIYCLHATEDAVRLKYYQAIQLRLHFRLILVRKATGGVFSFKIKKFWCFVGATVFTAVPGKENTFRHVGI